MTKARVIQLAIAAAVALGLVAAVVVRAPSAPPEPEAPAPSPDPRAARAATGPESPTPPVLPPASPPALAPGSPAPADEASLMAQLRSFASADRPRAIELAREGNRRFPDSPDAPERASILIHALAGEGNASEARRSAEEMVNHYPDSHWVQEVEQFTGAHRYVNRNLRLNADGGLEYY